MLVHRRFTPSIKFASNHLYTWVERGIERVKCLAQEHNTMSLARTRTWSARSRVKHTNHEATTPPTSRLYYLLVIILHTKQSDRYYELYWCELWWLGCYFLRCLILNVWRLDVNPKCCTVSKIHLKAASIYFTEHILRNEPKDNVMSHLLHVQLTLISRSWISSTTTWEMPWRPFSSFLRRTPVGQYWKKTAQFFTCLAGDYCERILTSMQSCKICVSPCIIRVRRGTMRLKTTDGSWFRNCNSV